MSGMKVGQPWAGGGWKDLRIEAWTGSDAQWAALTAVCNATLAAIDPAEYPAQDEAALRAYYGHPAFDLARDARLVWAGATPVGAGICYPPRRFLDRVPTNFEIFVVPGYQQHGIGARLLAHLTEAARARGHHALTTTISQHYIAGRDFLLHHGFRPIGQRARLTRPTMADLPEAGLPPGVTLVDLPALGGDPELYRLTCNRLGAYDSGYDLLQPEDLAPLTSGPGWQPDGVFFLRAPEGRLIGVIRAGQSRPGSGTLYDIRLDPAYRGQGLASALVAAALTTLARRGVTTTTLDTDAVDSPSYRLALRCGFHETLRWVDFLKPIDEQ
jgi:GNAT superfamily N-acetyltransferase